MAKQLKLWIPIILGVIALGTFVWQAGSYATESRIRFKKIETAIGGEGAIERMAKVETVLEAMKKALTEMKYSDSRLSKVERLLADLASRDDIRRDQDKIFGVQLKNTKENVFRIAVKLEVEDLVNIN